MADIPLASTWGRLEDPKAGYYGSEDLEATREDLFAKGVIAKPSLDHRGKIVRLRAACDDGSCVVLPLDERAAEIEAFLERHSGYRGLSLASAAHEVFVALIRSVFEKLETAPKWPMYLRNLKH